MLIRRGHRGAAVVDVQNRLVALGFDVDADERGGTFGPATEAAVRAFQQARGLVADGMVGPETWRELVEASWRLGDRTLYLRSPSIRGDDVRDLQERLSALGFDVGRVDGIFGLRTARGLSEFQRNYGIPPDGIVGDATLRSLQGLPHLAGTEPIASVREREALSRFRPTIAGLRVVLDPGHSGSEPGVVGPSGASEADVCLAIARRVEAALLAGGAEVFVTRDEDANPSESERARLANQLDADLFVAIHAGGAPNASARGAAAYYFGHDRYHSETGMRLAELLLEEVCSLGLTDGRSHAKTFTVLRETSMPAVQLESAYLSNPDEERLLADAAFQRRLAQAIASALRRLTREPLPTAP
jgi:N-acetylmuramoyl-L-alanine amidase